VGLGGEASGEDTRHTYDMVGVMMSYLPVREGPLHSSDQEMQAPKSQWGLEDTPV
jgi:hypothetical protein